jgi:hypothetical protein
VLPWNVIPFDGGNPSPPAETIINTTPTVTGNWTRSSYSDARGGFYYSALNTQIGVGTAAPPEVIWSGNLPAGAKRYRVDVYIPVQPGGRRPRTDSARYYIIYNTGGSIGPVVRFISQQVRSSQWVTLETVDFSNSGGRYAISLGAATNEAAGTKSVVANAVRLVPVP